MKNGLNAIRINTYLLIIKYIQTVNKYSFLRIFPSKMFLSVIVSGLKEDCLLRLPI